MEAHNPGNLSLAEMWQLLQNPEDNIMYVALVIKYEAERQGIRDFSSIYGMLRTNIFAAYNAGSNYLGEDGQRYGKATHSYYEAFSRGYKKGGRQIEKG